MIPPAKLQEIEMLNMSKKFLLLSITIKFKAPHFYKSHELIYLVYSMKQGTKFCKLKLPDERDAGLASSKTASAASGCILGSISSTSVILVKLKTLATHLRRKLKLKSLSCWRVNAHRMLTTSLVVSLSVMNRSKLSSDTLKQ